MKYFCYFLLTFSIAACNKSKSGSGNIITEVKKVQSFDAVSVSGSIEVDLQNGPTTSVIVETDDNIMPYVETSVTNGNLKIRLKDINNLRNSTVYVHIIAPVLKNLNTSASAKIKSANVLVTAEKMVLKASSGSGINVKIDAPAVTGEASSGAEITASGRTKDVNGTASSGSKISFGSLQSENAIAKVSSGAHIDIFASLSINANASSGGNIKYMGGAKSVQKNVSSGGSVNTQ